MTRHTDDSAYGEPDLHGGRLRVPRSRGAFSGVLLIIAGAWAALIPFLGPAVHFGLTPDSTFTMTRARFWLELLPGAVTVAGGVLLVLAADRVLTSLGAWLAVAGGGWLVVGPTLDRLLHLGTVGSSIHPSTLRTTLETLLLFTGIGALILFLGALAVGRLGVVSVRDVRAAQRREREHAADRAQRSDDSPASRDDQPSSRDERDAVRRAPTPSQVEWERSSRSDLPDTGNDDQLLGADTYPTSHVTTPTGDAGRPDPR